MKTQYTVAIAMFAGIVIGGITAQALHAQAKPRAYVVVEIDVMNQAKRPSLKSLSPPP